MKKFLLFLISLGLLVGIGTNSIYSQTLAPMTTSEIYTNVIYSPIKELLDIGAIYGDEAIRKTGYFKDKIYLNYEDPEKVGEEARKWMKDEVYKNIKAGVNKLFVLGYITDTEYEQYRNMYYTDIFVNQTDLSFVYKSFLSFEKKENDGKNTRQQYYQQIKSELSRLESDGKISNQLFDSWLAKMHNKIFLELNDPGTVYNNFTSELQKFLGILKIYLNSTQEVSFFYGQIPKDIALEKCKSTLTQERYSAIRCTWNGDEIYSYTSVPPLPNYTTTNTNPAVIPVITNPYLNQLRYQFGTSFSQMSLSTLETMLRRNKRIESRYTKDSRGKMMVQAIIMLLNEEIASRRGN